MIKLWYINSSEKSFDYDVKKAILNIPKGERPTI